MRTEQRQKPNSVMFALFETEWSLLRQKRVNITLFGFCLCSVLILVSFFTRLFYIIGNALRLSFVQVTVFVNSLSFAFVRL